MKKRITIEWTHSTLIDGRVRMPVEIRDAWKRGNVQTLYLTCGLGGCVALFTPTVWQTHVAKFNKLMAVLPAQQAAHLRQCFLIESMTPVPIEPSGWLPVPATLQQFAGLQRIVVVVQQAQRLELWQPQRWQEQLTKLKMLH